MVTDGDLPVIDLRGIAKPATARTRPATDSRDTRPASTVFSAGVSLTRGVVGLVIAGLFLVDPGSVTLTRDTRATTAVTLSEPPPESARSINDRHPASASDSLPRISAMRESLTCFVRPSVQRSNVSPC